VTCKASNELQTERHIERPKEFGEVDGEFDGEFSWLFSNSTQDHVMDRQETGDLMQHVVGQCDSPAPSEEI
jgi:hypothetical protein